MKPSDYFSQTRGEMRQFVPAGAQRILEIGCGEGLFGAQFAAEGKEMWGIESESAAAARATAHLTRVVCGDVLEKLSELPKRYFDVIVCNDVLEHVIDPYSVVALLQEFLVLDGVIVASLPNVRYLPVLWNLVVKKVWDYTDQGVLDRTHLRFFTEKNIRDLFAHAGYEVVTLTGINPIFSWKFSLFNWATFGWCADTRFMQFAVVSRLKPLRL